METFKTLIFPLAIGMILAAGVIVNRYNVEDITPKPSPSLSVTDSR